MGKIKLKINNNIRKIKIIPLKQLIKLKQCDMRNLKTEHEIIIKLKIIKKQTILSDKALWEKQIDNLSNNEK